MADSITKYRVARSIYALCAYQLEFSRGAINCDNRRSASQISWDFCGSIVYPLAIYLHMAVLHFSSLKELEHQSNPSRWNKRMSADAVINDHLAKTKAGKL